MTISIWIKVILFFLVVYLGVTTIKQYALLNDNNSISKIISSGNKKCKIELNSGKIIQANITAVGSLFDYFIVIVVKNNSNKITSIIAKDSISQEQFYALRLYLRSFKKQR